MGILNFFGNKRNADLTKLLANRQIAFDANQILNYGLPAINYDDRNQYDSHFKNVGALYEVTDLICKKIINCPIVVYKVKDAKKLKTAKVLEKSDPVGSYILKYQAIEEVSSLSLMRLLDAPNPYMTRDQFIWTTALCYLIRGNSYIYSPRLNGGKPTELYPIPNMEIIVDTGNILDPILGYKMLMGVNGDVLRAFNKNEVYHMKTANPTNMAMGSLTFDYLYGVSPLRAYLEPMRTIREANEQASKQVKNAVRMGLITPSHKEDALTKEQRDQLKEQFKKSHVSDDVLSRIIVGSLGLDFKDISLTIQDLELLNLISAKEEDIYKAYHVPLQYHNQKASTSNNQQTAVKQLIYDAVSPICKVISEMLTNFIGVHYDNVIIDLDYTQLPEMAVNMVEISKYVIPLVESGIITHDEARYALKYGETGLDHMNDFYVKSGLVRLKDLGAK